MENSEIQWTTHTFNPWIGCAKVSPGCDHCYAVGIGARLSVKWGVGEPRKRTKTWHLPERWNAGAEKYGIRPRVFCASLADVFDNEVPAEWRADLFALIRATPNLDWLLLTKRIGNAIGMMPPWWFAGGPLPNVWLGATVVNQEEADRDVPKLLATPAAVRFLSIEPILGEIQTLHWWGTGEFAGGIDWCIVGGESGPKARPTTIGHIRSIVKQCQQADIACFVKQLGAHPVNREGVPHPLKHPKGGEPAEWPADLRVRQFPTTTGAPHAIQS